MPGWVGDALALLTGPFGVFVGFILIVWSGAKGRWVFGRELEASEKRADEWKSVASTSLTTIQASIEALERRIPR